MSEQTIRNTLGQLQDEPDNEQAWNALDNQILNASKGGETDAGLSVDDVSNLLTSARHAHEMRREYEAVERLLKIQVAALRGSEKEADVVADLARVADEEL